MKLLAIFSLWLSWGSHENVAEATTWAAVVTSRNYDNMKLVLESENPFQLQYIKKGSLLSSARIVCSKYCANNATCQAFNFYSTSTHYVCEYLPENFCSQRQRVALQALDGGSVWDKLGTNMTKACIDQKFGGGITPTSHCDIGRPGCSSTWPNCDNCVQSCLNCFSRYSKSGLFNCTLWPEGRFKPPIFAFCDSKATIVIKRQVNLANGTVWPNYTMSFMDMNRLCKLSVYKTLKFTFNITKTKYYRGTYKNFFLDSSGTLTNLTYVPTPGATFADGFNLKGKPLKPVPFAWVPATSACGSFWLLNSTQRALSTNDCPGGGVGMFGSVDTTASPKKTGILWPKTTKSEVIFLADTKMDI